MECRYEVGSRAQGRLCAGARRPARADMTTWWWPVRWPTVLDHQAWITWRGHHPAARRPAGGGGRVLGLWAALVDQRSALTEEFMLEGIDISHWETVNDWPAVKAAGIRFVYLKATQAEKSVDRCFHKYRLACQTAGLPWGAYHFYDYRYPASPQVAHFITTVGWTAGRTAWHAATGGRPGAVHGLAGW